MRFTASAAAAICVLFSLSSAVLGQGDVTGSELQSDHHKARILRRTVDMGLIFCAAQTSPAAPATTAAPAMPSVWQTARLRKGEEPVRRGGDGYDGDEHGKGDKDGHYNPKGGKDHGKGHGKGDHNDGKGHGEYPRGGDDGKYGGGKDHGNGHGKDHDKGGRKGDKDHGRGKGNGGYGW
ncbi:hypothetical protein DFH09DRAFT_1092167 [Mycena vulgaris]|nr:hypothetical protein DFH09DRAFT_1092167 [Mycena vulgaris]